MLLRSLARPTAIIGIDKPGMAPGLKPFYHMNSELINMTRAWDKKKWIEPMTSRIPEGTLSTEPGELAESKVI